MNSKIWKEIKQQKPPSQPVFICLGCNKQFVWWVHPVQLCDDCVEKEYDTANQENK